MSKKKKYNFSREYIVKHRRFPIGNTILLAVLVIIQLTLAASMIWWYPSPSDTIKQYNVTVEPLDDGTLDITYQLVWEAQDATEPLTWVSIGMANAHYTVYPDSLSDEIQTYNHIVNDGYTALELHLHGEYYYGQVAQISFKINQRQMLLHDVGGYFYEFVPSWFNEIPVEQYTFRWKKSDKCISTQVDKNGYYEWSGSFDCGGYQMLSMRYDDDAFHDVKTVAYTPFDDSGTYNDLQNTKDAATVAAIFFIVLILVGETVIVDSYVSYGRGRGFLSGYGHPIHVYGRTNPRYSNAHHAHTTSHGGGFSGGGCACACACACAGGGRAGCSQKDTVGFSSVSTLADEIHAFVPANEQEARDKAQFLAYLDAHPDCFSREDGVAHITVSAWTVNKARTKTLMVYHKIYDSWSWIGGHADGERDLKAVALRELREETGIQNATLIGDGMFSLEILPVSGHFKRGAYVPSHLHLNVTYLVEADENEVLSVNETENTGVKWFSFEDALIASTEPWMVQTVYTKLIGKTVANDTREI